MSKSAAVLLRACATRPTQPPNPDPQASSASAKLLETVIATAAAIAVALLGALHVYILVLEMFLWTTPRGRKAFGLTPEFAEATKVLAANQGLYNGFLAAGLFWGLVAGPAVQLFFAGCVLVAGLYGAATASRRILFVQAVPAAITIALVLAAR